MGSSQRRLRFIGLAILAMSIFSPTNHVWGQGLRAAEGMAQVNAPGFTVIPWAKVGYQHMGINLSLPIPDEVLGDPAKFDIHPLDLNLQDANIWIGTGGLFVRRGDILFSAHASGNIPSNIKVSTDRFVATAFQKGGSVVSWRGSRFAWWEIEGWGGYPFFNVAAIGAGIKWTKTSVSLTDPEGSFVQPAPPNVSGVLSYSGDFQAKLIIPILVVEMSGANCTFKFEYSPFIHADVSVPLRFITLHKNGKSIRYEQGDYTLKKGGNFLEATFEYDINRLAPVAIQVWAKGGWIGIRGGGSYELGGNRVVIKTGKIDASWSGKGSEVSTFNTYCLSGGISATVPF